MILRFISSATHDTVSEQNEDLVPHYIDQRRTCNRHGQVVFIPIEQLIAFASNQKRTGAPIPNFPGGEHVKADTSNT